MKEISKIAKLFSYLQEKNKTANDDKIELIVSRRKSEVLILYTHTEYELGAIRIVH